MDKIVNKFDCYDFIQWTGDNIKDVIEFTGKHPNFDKWFKSFEDYERHVKEDGQRFKLFSGSSFMVASVGDYILKQNIHDEQRCSVVSEENFDKQYVRISFKVSPPLEKPSLSTTLNLSPVEDEFGILPHLQKFNAEGAFDGITKELNKFCENYMSDAEGIRKDVMVETSCLIKKIIIDANKGVISLKEGVKELDKYLDEYIGGNNE